MDRLIDEPSRFVDQPTLLTSSARHIHYYRFGGHLPCAPAQEAVAGAAREHKDLAELEPFHVRVYIYILI